MQRTCRHRQGNQACVGLEAQAHRFAALSGRFALRDHGLPCARDHARRPRRGSSTRFRTVPHGRRRAEGSLGGVAFAPPPRTTGRSGASRAMPTWRNSAARESISLATGARPATHTDRPVIDPERCSRDALLENRVISREHAVPDPVPVEKYTFAKQTPSILLYKLFCYFISHSCTLRIDILFDHDDG